MKPRETTTKRVRQPSQRITHVMNPSHRVQPLRQHSLFRNHARRFHVLVAASLQALAWTFAMTNRGTADEPTYDQAQTILTKYCAGCHHPDDANGQFALNTLEGLLKGGASGNAITPGSANSSLLIQLMKGQMEPKMPPEGEPSPSEDDIELVADWIDAGAAGPSGNPEKDWLSTPDIKSHVDFEPITALAATADGNLIAVGKFKTIEIRNSTGEQVHKKITGLPGKVNSLAFLKNGEHLVAGTGVSGLFGEALLIRVADGEITKRFRGHNDIVYSVALSPDEQLIATSSYDRSTVLWDVDSDQPLRTLRGHNDAIFENVFDRSGQFLITASADATVKIWRVSDGRRLDTRGEPLKEQNTVAVSPDGQWIVAGGADNRIRKWQLTSQTPNQTNPLAISRFAHESAIELLRFRDDGKQLVSVGGDGTLKFWDAETLTQIYQFPDRLNTVQAIAILKNRIIAGTLNGEFRFLDWPKKESAGVIPATNLVNNEWPKMNERDVTELEEREPNDLVSDAMLIEAPTKVKGTIAANPNSEVDTFRFKSKQGQRWVIEIRASRDQSPLDSHVAVLNVDGTPVKRVLLRAVRDSYFTFRGKNSLQTGDFRIHNWEEMHLNQLLYCNGEVVKLYHYPRGPDSGFNVYPNFGNRHGMFDTTPIAHALHEPCYVVEAHPPGTELPATGLPQFLLNYENDDDAERELGTDSRLTFVAPEDGEYLVRVKDTRGLGGETFTYQLNIRPERPGFALKKINGMNPTLIRGVYKTFEVRIDRKDNFTGPVEIEIVDLPPGIEVDGPITVEQGGLRAYFTLFATNDMAELAGDEMSSTVTATALINGKPVKKSQTLGKITLGDNPKLLVSLTHSPDAMPHFSRRRLPVLEIRPGETITAQVSVERLGYNARVNFGKEDAALNLPFGIYVDNTGLNGVLIPPDESTRQFFLTAESWVEPCERLIFLQAEEAGKPASNPAILRVLPLPGRESE